jgi:hypothetical protein
MRSRMNHTVSAPEVESLAGGILRRALALVDHGYKCTAHTILLVLFFAASRSSSIFDACRRLRDVPSDQAIRNALGAWMPEMPELERRINRALRARLPKGLWRRAQPMAADISAICYYGRHGLEKRELCRGQRKQGTTRFHCYATLYVVRRGERFTIAMTYVWQGDSHAEVVRRLLRQAQRIGLRPRYLMLDRGFYGLGVVRYLKSVRCPFLMPVVHRGRRSKRPLRELKGTRRFLARKRSGWSTHVMQNRQERTPVSICVVCRKKKRRPLVFAFWGFRPGSPVWVAEEYRRRYGIETSYRQMNQGRIRTCSRDVRLRLLLVGIALLLRNVWVWLHRMILGCPRGRGIELHLERLRLRTMLLMLQRCAEACLKCADFTQDPVCPPLQAALGP